MKEFYRFSSSGFVCACLFLFSVPRAYPQTLTPRNITTGSNSNGFYEYLPAGYNPSGSQTYPLMVFLEGVGEHGNGTTDLTRVLNNGPAHLMSIGEFPASFTVNGTTFSFIVITPQFVNTPSETDVDAIIQYALSNYKVDANRIYLTGLSEGGGATWAYPGYSLAFADKIAAILPVCGAIGINDHQAHNIASGTVAVFATHNIDDPSVDYHFTVANVNAVNSATPPPGIPALDTIFPDPDHNGHDAWLVTYDPTIPVYKSKLNVYQWMLQYSRASLSSPLPITLTDYSAAATADGTAVDVDWSTAQELNNSYFILQRSGDARTFVNLDTIAAAPAPGGGHAYAYADEGPLAGDNFYRLEQVDENGKITVYGTLKVTIGAARVLDLQVSPNPTAGVVKLRLADAGKGTLTLHLLDLRGNLLRTYQFEKQDNYWSQSIDLGGLPAGTYVLHVRGKMINAVRTLVKE